MTPYPFTWVREFPRSAETGPCCSLAQAVHLHVNRGLGFGSQGEEIGIVQLTSSPNNTPAGPS